MIIKSLIPAIGAFTDICSMDAFVQQRVHKDHWKHMAIQASGDPELLEKLVAWTLQGQGPVDRNASETIRFVYDMHPELFYPYLDRFIEALNHELPNHVKRCIYRITQNASFTEEQEGKLIDLAFKDFTDNSNPIAVRVFAMTTIYSISKRYPDLYEELVQTIKPQLEGASAGFKNRAGKILNKTYR